MPRKSSGGRSAPRAAPRPAPRPAPMHNPPQPASHAPPPAPLQGGGGSGGFLSTMAQGVALGTGSAIAHRAVDAVLGPRTIQHETVVSEAAPAPTPAVNSMSDSCSNQNKAFQDCLNNYGSDISKCQFYLDMLSECRRNSGAVLGA